MIDHILLIGAKVTLRTTVIDDGPTLIAIRQTDEVRSRWRGEHLTAEFLDDFDDDELWRFTIKAGGEIVGLIQFAEEQDPEYHCASIDVYIDPRVHRHGYASDAIATLVDYLFDERGHHRITIDPALSNEAAIACYASVGFQPVGVLRQYERQPDGTWSDGLLMDLVKEDRIGRDH